MGVTSIGDTTSDDEMFQTCDEEMNRCLAWNYLNLAMDGLREDKVYQKILERDD